MYLKVPPSPWSSSNTGIMVLVAQAFTHAIHCLLPAIFSNRASQPSDNKSIVLLLSINIMSYRLSSQNFKNVFIYLFSSALDLLQELSFVRADIICALFTNKYRQAEYLAHTSILWMDAKCLNFFFFTSPVVKGTLTGAQETSAELGSTSSHEGPVPLDVGII